MYERKKTDISDLHCRSKFLKCLYIDTITISNVYETVWNYYACAYFWQCNNPSICNFNSLDNIVWIIEA